MLISGVGNSSSVIIIAFEVAVQPLSASFTITENVPAPGTSKVGSLVVAIMPPANTHW